jgi:glycosyltransferase involved in cell wall biosynthesis
MDRRFRRIEQSRSGRRTWQLGFVGSLEQLYKAPDIVLRAIGICVDRGLQVRLSLLGEGRYRPRLERLGADLGLGGSVCFRSAVSPGREVDEFLESIDLFVLASRTEGLPRVLVEAMARGCPAIGSTAGGIPELLAAEDLVEPGDATALANKIGEALTCRGRLEQMARRNRAVAEEYAPERLAAVRGLFLGELAALARSNKDCGSISAGELCTPARAARTCCGNCR